MDEEKFRMLVLRILERDPRYDVHAYRFISEAVSFTIAKAERESLPPGQRHVSPEELVRGTLEFAIRQFGPLAGPVMEYWNVHCGLDIGNIVFNMIHEGILTASPEDTLEAFDSFYEIPAFLDSMQKDSMRIDEPPLHPPHKIF